jgi:hypothetical protein
MGRTAVFVTATCPSPRDEAEGVPRCARPRGYRRLRESRARPDREEPGSARAGCITARLLEVCRVPKRASGPYLAARRRDRVASEIAQRRGLRHHLEIAGLQYCAQHSDQPDLCRRLCVRAHDQPGERRERSQACAARRASADGRMVCSDQGSS